MNTAEAIEYLSHLKWGRNRMRITAAEWIMKDLNRELQKQKKAQPKGKYTKDIYFVLRYDEIKLKSTLRDLEEMAEERRLYVWFGEFASGKIDQRTIHVSGKPKPKRKAKHGSD